MPPHLADGVVIECLLHYDDSGLIGIQNHFPQGSPMNLPGDVTLVVRRDPQRRGVGTPLVQEARRRWKPIDLENQRTTPAGTELANAATSTRLGHVSGLRRATSVLHEPRKHEECANDRIEGRFAPGWKPVPK